MQSKIEQVITEIEEFIDGCKFQPFSSTKILVEKEHIDELLRELRNKTPDEIKRYQKVISQKEEILNDARERADAMLAETQIHQDQMIEEHEIMQQAYAQAQQIVDQATQQAQQIVDQASEEANNIRQSVMDYTDDMLAELENIVVHAIDTAEAKYGDLLAKLKESKDVIEKNRDELKPKADAKDSEPASPDVLI